MKLIFLCLLFSVQVFGQNTVSKEEMERLNYQEVKGVMKDAKASEIPDKYPMYPNGLDGLYRNLSRNLKYPSNAKKNKIQGKVIIWFFVEKDGSIGTVTVAKSIDPDLDAAAVEFVKTLGTWIPGYYKGQPKTFLYKLPITFRLPN